jgi:hypothetical protein
VSCLALPGTTTSWTVTRRDSHLQPDCLGFPGGGEGTRTLGLYIANVALYQLSYTPGNPKCYSTAVRGIAEGESGQTARERDHGQIMEVWGCKVPTMTTTASTPCESANIPTTGPSQAGRIRHA